jgi:hypothetical protein
MRLQAALKSQYHGALAMLSEAVAACPASLWTSDRYVNPYWQVAYHALFYTHLYLMPAEADFVPWEHHREGHHRFTSDLAAARMLSPYSVEEVEAYGQACQAMVDAAVDALDLDSPDSGFYWYKMPKLEHQFVNLRHIQHHTGQLADRLRLEAGRGLSWVPGRPDPA